MKKKKGADPQPPEPQAPAPALQESEEQDRAAQPVAGEQPPHLPFTVVGIGASAGGIEAFSEFFEAMPADSGMAFVLIQHLPPDRESMIAEIIARRTDMPVQQVKHGMRVEPDQVYVIRPGHTLTMRDGAFHLGAHLEKPRHGRPIDDFFRSLAEEQRERSACIVMSGMGSNGAAGAQAIKAVGGLCIAQEPESAQFASMPRHLIDAGYADFILRPSDMPDALIGFARHPYAAGLDDAEKLVRREEQHLREILAILRTRTRQDFTGYKKPTILRRIQRRMGLNRITRMGEYAKVLRQSPVEVSALADDLLIHVTGFFRDAPAWEALKKRVIAPLVESRESGGSVRCWVTACASGEEAYSLAILLMEECERLNKSLDIKIFATDTAERTLANARNGIYPGGIESEMSPERVERFFQREDAVYRVRQDLREKVVFAPQNVLQDPPFSKLDVVSCRNLLIYLEPEIQQRLITLLHFGLREGGALFLGTSETIADATDMFETVDKRARIYRRIGSTRHGAIEFPLPHGIIHAANRVRREARAPSPSVAQLTARTLLARHVPAAVTINRDYHVVHYHGDTSPFLAHPTGAPTHELFSLVVDPLRGAVRSALQRSMANKSVETVSDRCIEIAGVRKRVVVTVSPVEASSETDLYVISFQERADVSVPPVATNPLDAGFQDELQRMREDLQNTIEELQASNEEHKASAEEVMSINEELQSSNEELETSKEEMQSLNEELTTVNAQLQAKMEELQNTSNDLAALLSSTDIAVIFLDRQFRIRRFTPAAKAVAQMIDSDIGRPLRDLSSKFIDPELLVDAAAVLDRLTPVDKEITDDNGRWYLRRILPYRTTDNRIDGVVLTFLDITERKRSEDMLRASKGQLAAELDVLSRLYDVSTRVLDATNLPLALQEILIAATDLIGCQKGDIQLLEPDGRTLKRAASRGFDQAQAQALSSSASSQDAVRFERRILIEDTHAPAQSEASRALAAAAGYRAVVSTPLKTRHDAVVGVFSAYFEAPHAPSERELRVIELFARHASDLIERLRTEDKLGQLLRAEQATSRALDEAMHLKDEFLTTLSHELRTPLNVIMLWLRVMRDAGGMAERAEASAAIWRSTEVLSRLIDDLLDASRIAAGKMRLVMESTNLATVVRSAVDAIQPTAESKGVHVETAATGDVTVMADPQRLHQVLWNLLINSVKFTPSGGRVEVHVAVEQDRAVVSVRDTGGGIAPELLPFVFDRFRQGAAARVHSGGGLGVGLSIAKQLVELHGGTIEAASEGPEKGATFTLRLPLSPAGAGAAPSAGAPGAGQRLDGLRLLLVEDECETQGVMNRILTDAGASVTCAETAKEALEVYRESPPDAIVSDIGLPDLDGYALLRRIRALDAELNRTPVPAIAVTAYALDRDRRRAEEAGYQAHVAKPVDGQLLVRAIRKLVPA